jgi:hypothetical protein
VTILNEPAPSAVEHQSIIPPTQKQLRKKHMGRTLVGWLTSTDHKVIGHLYFITSMAFFFTGGIMALLIRAELTNPGQQFISNEQYNQMFTMHGSIMLLLFATPLFAAFANAIMPLQIGAPDVAFPRLNMLAYWFYLFGGLVVLSATSLHQGRPTSVGLPTRHFQDPSTRRASVAICGYLASPSPGWGQSWVPSTS